MPPYKLQDSPFVVPTADGKIIKEHFGLASKRQGQCSVAQMIAPPGWSEPAQRPEFDEITLMIRGRKQVEIDDETIYLTPGQAILISSGSRVRYSNPFGEEAEYISICLPAFSPEIVNREE